MSHSDFIDWKKVTKQIGSNFTCTSDNDEYSKNDTVNNELSAPGTEKKLTEIENANKKHPRSISIADLKIVKMIKGEPRVMYVKTSYKEKEFLKINVDGTKQTPTRLNRKQRQDETIKHKTSTSENQNKKKCEYKKKSLTEFKHIECLPAYPSKLEVEERKKLDILSLIKSNHIPKFY